MNGSAARVCGRPIFVGFEIVCRAYADCYGRFVSVAWQGWHNVENERLKLDLLDSFNPFLSKL